MSILKPGMQPHHMLGNSPGSPNNLLGSVRSSLAQPDLASPVEQPLAADPMAQPTDVYVAQHQPVKRHLGQRGGLVGGVLLTAGLLLGAASLSEGTTEIDHMPEGITRFLDGEVPGLGNSDLASAQLFAELEGELVRMEVVDGMHSDLLSSGTLASAGSNLAAVLASAKPKGKWGKIKKWLGNNKGTKWLKKKLKKPAAWVAKHPFGSMGIMAGLFLLNLITLRMLWKASRKRSGKKIYANDILKGRYFDTGTIFIANTKNNDGQYQIISSNEAQRDILVEFTKGHAIKLRDVLRKLYKEDSEPYKRAKLNTEQELIGRRGWLQEVGGHPDNDEKIRSEDKRYNLMLAPHEDGFFKRRWRYWRCTKRDERLQEAQWLVMRDEAGKTLPWANRWLKWIPGVMSLKKAEKIVKGSNVTMVVGESQLMKAKSTNNGNGNKQMTTPPLSKCYTVDGDTVTIHRDNRDPLSFSGWQATALNAMANAELGPKLSVIMLPIESQYPGITEDTVKSFLRELVKAGYATASNGHYKLKVREGTAEDAKRLSGDKEAVTFFTPATPPAAPPPIPKPAKPQYKMSEGGSTMLIGTPEGDIFTFHDWQIRALMRAKKVKTPDQIFEGLGLTDAEREIFDNFIKSAIENGWLRDVDTLGVDFILEENPELKAPSRPHPKALPTIDDEDDGTGTVGWTDVVEKKPAAAPKPASPPKAAPPVGTPSRKTPPLGTPIAAAPRGSSWGPADSAPDGSATKLGVAGTVLLQKDTEAAAMAKSAPKTPEPDRVKGVPELTLPQKPVVPAAASAPTSKPEKAVELVADLPGPRNEKTVVLPGSKVDGLADDSKPQTGVPTKMKPGVGTQDDPAMLSQPAVVQPAVTTGNELPAPRAVTFDKPPAMVAAPPPTPMDADKTTEFQRDQVDAAITPSVVVSDDLIMEEEDAEPKAAKSAKSSPPPRKIKARIKGEGKKTVVVRQDGTTGAPIILDKPIKQPDGDSTIELSGDDLVELRDGDGSDED